MFAGTLLVGLSGFLFLAVIGHGRFDAATSAALSATYLLGNVLGVGVFIAVEQETSRVVSDSITKGGDTRLASRRIAAVDSGLAFVTLLTLAAAAPLLLSRVLDGEFGLVLALAVAIIGSAAVYLIRGLTGGHQHFRRYAMTVLLDGATRVLGCLALVMVGNTNPVAYGLALCAGPGVAALSTARHAGSSHQGTVGVAPGIGTLARGVSWLLIASALWMAMANLAPVVVTAMLPGDPVTAAGFAAAVVLTRVPLLFMGPIQAMILPAMTSAVAVNDRRRLGSTVIRGLMLIIGIGIVAVIGTALLGRPVISMLLGSERDTTDTSGLVWLTVSSALFMSVMLLQPALVALRRHRALVFAWVAGAIAFTVSFLVPLSAVDRGVLAQITGPLVTLAVELAVLGSYWRPSRRAGNAAQDRDTGPTVAPQAPALDS